MKRTFLSNITMGFLLAGSLVARGYGSDLPKYEEFTTKHRLARTNSYPGTEKGASLQVPTNADSLIPAHKLRVKKTMIYLKKCVGIARQNFVAINGESPVPTEENTAARHRAILLSRLNHDLHHECFTIEWKAEQGIEALVESSLATASKILNSTAAELEEMVKNIPKIEPNSV